MAGVCAAHLEFGRSLDRIEGFMRDSAKDRAVIGKRADEAHARIDTFKSWMAGAMFVLTVNMVVLGWVATNIQPVVRLATAALQQSQAQTQNQGGAH